MKNYNNSFFFVKDKLTSMKARVSQWISTESAIKNTFSLDRSKHQEPQNETHRDSFVARATATADELTKEELIEGMRILTLKVRRFAPRWLAVVGAGAYRTAFERPRAKIGPQEETIGASRIWLLPNPSGLNANYRPSELVELFGELRDAVARSSGLAVERRLPGG